MAGDVGTCGGSGTCYQSQGTVSALLVEFPRLGVSGTCKFIQGGVVSWCIHLHIARITIGQNLMGTGFGVVTHILHLQAIGLLVFAVAINLGNVETEPLRQLGLRVYIDLDGAALAHHLQIQRVVLLEESGAQHVEDS